MRTFAYAYCPTDGDLALLGEAERVYVDWNKRRIERAAMAAPGALRDGDVLLILSWRSLARGKALITWRGLLAERGVTVRIVEPRREAKPNGRPGFSPSPEQDALIAAEWGNPALSVPEKIRRASEIVGGPVKYDQLYYRYETLPARQASQ